MNGPLPRYIRDFVAEVYPEGPELTMASWSEALCLERATELLRERKTLTEDRDRWKERHDRERSAHAANLHQQQLCEERIRKLEAALRCYDVPRAGGSCECGKCDPGKIAREALAGE